METKLYYKNLRVYQLSKVVVKDVYHLIKKYPAEERYALCDQLRRAVISVPSNIVEGLSRTTDKEKHQFLNITYGSLMEVLCQLDVSVDLGYISNDELKYVEVESAELIRMMKGMMRNYNGEQS